MAAPPSVETTKGVESGRLGREPDVLTMSAVVWRAVRSVTLSVSAATITAVAPTGALVFIVDRASNVVAPNAPLAGTAAALATLGVVWVASVRAHRLTREDRAAIRVGYFVGVAVFLFALLRPLTGGWRDASAYYTLGLDDPYGLAYASGGVRYPPPFFQLVEPLRWLDWPAFLFAWTAAQLAALWITAGPIAAVLLIVPNVAVEAWYANINLILALAVTLGFRWPALWSAVLLTKITPGVGLVWFAVRREWRSLATALGMTMAIALVSLCLSPSLWASWLGAITSSAPPDGIADTLPIWFRVGLAAFVVAWGGLHDRPWTVPLGAAIAMPVLWPAALSVLVAIIPLGRPQSRSGGRRAVDWALGSRKRLSITGRADDVATG